MEINIQTCGDCTVLDLSGELVLGQATIQLRSAVRETAATHPRKIVVNLRRVTYLDSCGLGELISSYTHAKSLGGKLVLLDPPDRVMKLLLLSRLDTVFEIFRDQLSAIADPRQNKTLLQKCG